MNKKLMRLFLLSAILLCALLSVPLSASAAYEHEGVSYTDGGTFADGMTWLIEGETSTLILSGEGAVPDYSSASYTPWSYYIPYVRHVVIKDGVSAIGENAINDFPELRTVEIPASVLSIGTTRFAESRYLEGFAVDSDNPAYESDAHGSLLDRETGLFLVAPKTLSGTVFLGDTVTGIAKFAFENCSALTGITLSSTITDIGYGAFYGCTSLTDIVIPDNVTALGAYAFGYCTALSDVTLGNGLSRLAHDTFSYCSSLQSVLIPDSVTYLDYSVFYQCSSLTTLYIGAGVTETIGQFADGCENLRYVFVSDQNPAFCNIGEYNSVLYTKDLTQLWFVAPQATWTDGVFVIPEGVETIRSHAFAGCANLKILHCPSTLSSIDNAAFVGCPSLTAVHLNEGLWSIADAAFGGCVSLTEIVIPDSVEYLGYSAFNSCQKLKKVTVGSGITDLYSGLFQGCTSLTQVTIGEQVTTIWGSAFEGCSALCELTVPSKVTWIGDRAFADCTSLESITLPRKLKTVTFHTFSACTSLATVIYGGTEAEWAEVELHEGNECLQNAAMQYMATAACTHETGSWSRGWIPDIAQEGHRFTCDSCSYYRETPHTSDGGKVQRPASCRMEGLLVHTCTDCGSHMYDEAIPMTDDHTYGEWIEEDEEIHKRTCEVCRFTATASHTWNEGELYAPSTCSAYGLNLFTCTDCGATKTEQILELAPHTFVNDCDPSCEVCEYARNAGHAYGDELQLDEEYHWYACLKCGEISEVSVHSWINRGEVNEEGKRFFRCGDCGAIHIITAPPAQTDAPPAQTDAPTSDTDAPPPETSTPSPETDAPAPETSAPSTEAGAPVPETSAPETGDPEDKTDVSDPEDDPKDEPEPDPEPQDTGISIIIGTLPESVRDGFGAIFQPSDGTGDAPDASSKTQDGCAGDAGVCYPLILLVGCLFLRREKRRRR